MSPQTTRPKGRTVQTEARYSEEWHELPIDRAKLSIVLHLIGKGRCVLDIGSYDGTIARAISDQGNDVYGVDLSMTALKLARAKQIEAIPTDAETALPFRDSSFDVVFAGEVIEHMFHTDNFLEECRHVLRPGGFLIITTPNLASLGRRILLLIGRNPLVEVSPLPPAAGHIRYFVKSSLFQLLYSHNFSVEVFTSEGVNFDNSGRHFSSLIGRLCPTIGRSLIVKATANRKR